MITITYECDTADRLPDEVNLSSSPSRTNVLRALVEAHVETDNELRQPIYLEEYRERRDLERASRP